MMSAARIHHFCQKQHGSPRNPLFLTLLISTHNRAESHRTQMQTHAIAGQESQECAQKWSCSLQDLSRKRLKLIPMSPDLIDR